VLSALRGQRSAGDCLASITCRKGASLRYNPADNIADIENVETVFKDGMGYDSAKLIESVRGSVGLR
jgi:hypothetical protein